MSSDLELTAAEYESRYGEGSVEKLQKKNLARLGKLFLKATRHCQVCDYPLELNTILSTTCDVCSSIRNSLSTRQYWIDLEAESDRRRRSAGL